MAEANRETVRIYGQEYIITGNSSGEQISEVAEYVDNMMNDIAGGAPSISLSALAVLTAVNITNDYFDARNKITEMEGELANLQKDADHYVQLWEEAKASFRQYKEDAANSIEQLQELQRIYNIRNVELNKANDEIEELNEKITSQADDARSLKSQLDEAETRISELEKQLSQAGEDSEALKSQLDDADTQISELQKQIASDDDDAVTLKSRLTDADAQISDLKKQVQMARSTGTRSSDTETADMAETKKKYKELENSFFDIQMENIRMKNELDNLKKGK